MPEPCSVEEHLERVLAGISPLPVFPQPLGEALGLAVAEDITAPIDLPPFDNSAMDGYAVRQADVASASAESPVHLPVVGEIGAGQARLLALSPGTTAKIMTGAPVPHGAHIEAGGRDAAHQGTPSARATLMADQSPSS